MLVRALLIAALLVGGHFFIRWFRRSPRFSRMPQLPLVAGIVGFLVLLTVRGGAEFAVPLLIVLVPFLRSWLATQRLPSSPATDGDNTSPGRSTINTRFLHMTLDHATGTMAGLVREGRFAGHELQDLKPQEHLDLWRECRADPQSVAVLEAYLDRHGDPAWRDRLGESERSSQTGDTATARSGYMERAEAYEILGLRAGASCDEIQAAYRRLIQRLHPDQGGSAYLAACLNRARDSLMESFKRN